MPPKFKLHIHFTKSPKRDNIYKLCLWMLKEIGCLKFQHWYVPTLRYRAHTPKCKPLLHCAESLKHANIEIFGS